MPSYNSAAQKPPSLLSTWLNRKTLPELYAVEQIGTAEYEKQLLRQLGEAQKRSSASEETCRKMQKLAAFYCATTHFPKGEALLISALAIRENQVGANPRSLLPDLDNLALIYSIEGNKARLQQFRARARAIRKGQRTQAAPLPAHFHKDFRS